MPEIVVFILVVLVTINDTLTIPFLTTGVAPSLESAAVSYTHLRAHET